MDKVDLVVVVAQNKTAFGLEIGENKVRLLFVSDWTVSSKLAKEPELEVVELEDKSGLEAVDIVVVVAQNKKVPGLEEIVERLLVV